MRVAVVAAAIVAFSCQLARAEGPPGMTPLAPAPAARAKSSYHAQTLGPDGIAVALLMVNAGGTSEGLLKLSVGTYVLGGPLVHLIKNRPGRGLVSLTMRVALPVAGGMLGASMENRAVCDDRDSHCPLDEGGLRSELLLGVVAGVVAASVIDAAFLTRGDKPSKPAPAWAPTARATQGGFALGVHGSF